MTEKSATPAKPRSVWSPILPVPEAAPAAKVKHGNRGEPLRVFIYRNAEDQILGYACRFLTSTGEALHLPLTWCQDQDGMRAWRWIQFQRLRPLFGLDRLAAEPDEVVVLCFDEHAADWAGKLLPFPAVSWSGGARNIDQVDWAPLRGRRVWIWPPFTQARAKLRRDVENGAGPVLPRERQPGWMAALKLERIVTGYGGEVTIIDPWLAQARPEGWDAGMMGLQDWSPEQAIAWAVECLNSGAGTVIEQRIRKLKGEPEPIRPPLAESVLPPSEAGAGGFESSADEDVFIPALVYRNGGLASCLSNVYQILAHRAEWRGVVALDTFALKIMKLKPPPYHGGKVGEWSDTDDTRTAMLLQRQYGFTPSSLLVRESIVTLAEDSQFNPVLDWLRSLKWDGTQRLDHWIVDYMGVEEGKVKSMEYVRLVARWWLMQAVARVLRPGCKADYVLVLEGPQGKKKSSALEILGRQWFGDNELDFSNKDSMMALQGKLIYEIPELGALARSDERRQKAFLTRKIDEFRPPFGRGFVKQKRQMIFAGSTNEWEWNKDPTGGRRFWPIPCDEINLDGLASVVDQLFAEAMVMVLGKERYWPTEDEQRRLFDPEQLKIEQADAFVDALHDWVFSRSGNFSLADAAMNGLKIDASKLTRDVQTRIGVALRKLGCTKIEKLNGMTRFWYKPPAQKEEVRSQAATTLFGGVGEGDAPF